MRNSIQIPEETDLENMIAYAAAAGLTEVSISLGSGQLCYQEDYEVRAHEIRALLDRYGIVCGQTHLPCYHLLIDSAETTEETENAIKNAFHVSAILGAGWTAFHPRTSLASGYDRNKSFDDNREKLETYLAYAEKWNVGIAVENMPLYPFTHPEWRFFGGGWEELITLADSFNSDKIGICWDFGHGHTAALDQTAALRAVSDRLKITHVHDNYRNGDHHQLPGLACTDWDSIHWDQMMAALKEIHYEGPLTLEILYPPQPMRKSYVACCAGCLDYLRSL